MGKFRALFLAAVLFAGVHSEGNTVELRADTAKLPLFEAGKNVCSKDFIPDSPARAFRRSDGSVYLIASHYFNWAMIGSNIFTAKTICRSVLDPADYGHSLLGQAWIQGTFSSDGKTVFALVSHDMSGPIKASGCNADGIAGKCWLNDIRSAVSIDMGTNFKIGKSVASYGTHYPEGNQSPYGFFAVSNIVRHDGFLYSFIFSRSEQSKKAGSCLMRTSDIADPASWRAWDGKVFSVSLLDSSVRCQPIFSDTMGIVRSIAYVSKENIWVGITTARIKLSGDLSPIPGVYYFASPDLINWGHPRRLMSLPISARVDSYSDVYSYPSILDPNSRSRNFETLDSNRAILLISDHHLRNGNGTLNRDLVYYWIDISE